MMANKYRYGKLFSRSEAGKLCRRKRAINNIVLRLATGVLVLLLAGKDLYAQDPPPIPAAYQSINDVKLNFIRTWEAAAPETNPNTIMTRDLRDVKQTTQYLDGLGRPLQTVFKKGSLTTLSGANVDLINAIVYDNMGRQKYQYLQFASTATDITKDNGLFKLNPFQQQAAFYNTQLNGQAGETNVGPNQLNWAFEQINYERSPMDRVNETFAAGKAWSGTSFDPVAANRHSLKTQYYNNTTADAVRIWNVDDVANAFGTYNSPGAYPDGRLYKIISIDEDSKQTVQFYNKEGKLILKKIQLTASDNGTGSGHGGWLCTYYLYDGVGNLRCIVQPKGVELISPNWLLNDATILSEQCFRYEYNDRNRINIQKRPGAAPEYMIYDRRDRLVMLQDGKMTGKWLVTLYDDNNRPVQTGFWTNGNDWIYHTAQAKNSSNYYYPFNESSIPGTGWEELTKTFYDGYDWLSTNSGHGFSATRSATDDIYLLSPSASYPYPQDVLQSDRLKGLITGTKMKVLGTFGSDVYLYTISYYDDKGRVIQLQSRNFAGGVNTTTTQYGWSGQPLLVIDKTLNPGPVTHIITILTSFNYDDLGRLVRTDKKTRSSLVNNDVMSPNWTTISKHEYDAIGQLKKKKLGNKPGAPSGTVLANLDYEYNARGWMLSINKNYITASSNNDEYFGMELGYDKHPGLGTFAPQYNGNISGTLWKSQGDQHKRKYDFSYDAVNRLTGAGFTQYVSGSGASAVFNTSALVDFSVSNLSYDANGNILTMSQKGLKFTSSGFIDQLSYVYKDLNKSNKLQQVTDVSNEYSSKLGDFKYDPATKTSTDYDYDANGNLLYDKNKKIDWIDYNYMNLVQGVSIRDKSNVTNSIIFKYDGTGKKIQKEVYPGAVPPGKVTLYLGDAEFQDNILQHVSHEEGRIRFTPAKNAAPAFFSYDYFIKDHLGNIRMVLTEESKTNQYPAASMENVADKNDLNDPNNYIPYYSNTDYTVSPGVRSTKPSGYPVDNFTNPNTYATRLKSAAGSQKIGPGILLKVMAGDKFTFQVGSWYKKNGATLSPNPVPLLNELISALTNNTGAVTGTHGGATAQDLQNNNVLNSVANDFLPTQPFVSSRPKAYVSWILFDEQFKLVATNSGAEQVPDENAYYHNGNPSTGTPIVNWHSRTGMPVDKSGYLYIYVSSDEQNVDVYFDNLMVTHIRGQILEETQYYPFGLVQQGISSEAINFGNANKLKYNGKEEQRQEFSDGTGLDWMDYGSRMYDQQIGRWMVVDPKADKYEEVSAYTYALNNPVRYIDLGGLEPGDPIKEVRLIFAGGAKKVGDNGAFTAAAKNVNATYGGKGKILEAKSSDYISKTINSYEENTVASLDILTHGSQVAFFMYKKYEGDDDWTNVSMYDWGWTKTITGDDIGKEAGKIDDIKFNRFTDNAIIEIHGCKSAADNWFDLDNIAVDMSQKLDNAGKKNAVVIAHVEKANPLINGKKTTNKQQDYRHGKRVVYHDGKVLFSTSKKGHIGRKVIDRYLKRKKDEEDYDGTKEVYK